MAKSAASPKPVLYDNPVPLDSKKHAGLALKKDIGLGFAATVHAVPITLAEFAPVCHAYPIVFSREQTPMPVAVLGAQDHENLFVTPKGQWIDDTLYVPSYLRRYPFIFAEVKASNQLTLCINEDQKLFDKKGERKIFDKQGKATPLTQNALAFCKSFHAATLQTREFMSELIKSGLLVDREAILPTTDKKKLRFGGFRVIDPQKWAAVDDKLVNEWRRRGWLGAVYAHLFSVNQWERLARLYAKKHAAKTR